ncbi:ABC transporter substrate-binding protein [Bacillus sp. HNG]|uniref:ABC transporter substrate-binding protein n=1 Tax=Bacillus sp. HNG TaxID=2293325 RepID=UPI000E2FB511|nr:ABC transporter substrate-binding protein [Bacillus sp. HNG]RFB10984.1 ABC transporter substrate-binding protein [Bacillus sp. HNG]
MKRKLLILLAVLLLALVGCSSEGSSGDGEPEKLDKIVLADAGWDSIRFHNSIAQRILEDGYGYKTEVTAGSTAATLEGLRQGDINVYMEVWTDNVKELYQEMTDAGDIETVSTNFDDNSQGLYVPTYVIEGDKERGIEPLAPDLKTVEDLKKYPEVFPDPEDSSKGLIVGAPTGWAVGETMSVKVDTYGLGDTFNYISPGSDSSAVATLVDAYEKGKGWVGYYWSPTWVTAKYDLTLLEEPEYNEEQWNKDYGTEFPPNDVVVAVHKDMPEQAPEVVEFLKNYKTSNDLTEEALKYMNENDASAEEAALWWMKQHEDVWTSWVSEDVAEKVKKSLE